MQLRYRDDITGLRAIAVLAVVANHFSEKLLPGGNLGVDTFFVISGFVITRSLMGRGHGKPVLPYLVDFYERRVRRLLPALVAMVVVTAPLFSLVAGAPREGLLTGLASLVGMGNFYLLYKNADYFSAPTRPNPFTHTWSLGVEEQFYLIFPLLAFVFLFAGGGRRERWFVPVVAGLMLASLAGLAWMLPRDQIAAFYASPLRFWELALGCLLARLPEDFGARSKLTPAVQPVALAALAGTFALHNQGSFWLPVAAVAASGALIAFGGGERWLDRLLCTRPAQYFGRTSYSLYLWHWPVLALARQTVGVTWTLSPLLLAAMLGLAHFSYTYVERAWMRPVRPQPLFRKAFVAGGMVATAGVCVMTLAYPLSGKLFLGTQPPIVQNGSGSLLTAYASPVGGAWAGAPCVIGSAREVGRPVDFDHCTVGRASAPHRLLVTGNSYATAFIQGVAELAEDPRYKVTLLAAHGASASPRLPAKPSSRLGSEDYWSRYFPGALARLKPGDTVLLISEMSAIADPAVPDAGTPERRRRYFDDLAELAGRMKARGVRLAVLYGVPIMEEAKCSPEQAIPQWFAPGARQCSYVTRAAMLRRKQGIIAGFSKLANDGLVVPIDALDDLCPGKVCSFTAPDGTFLYRDEYGHVSVEGARHVAPTIAAKLGIEMPPLDSPESIASAVH